MTRSIICLSGEDAWKFLQGLITNDLPKGLNILSYGALLTPQGKFLFDFFIFSKNENEFLIDIDNIAKDEFLFRISTYKLRLKIDILETKVRVLLSPDRLQIGSSMPDPRNRELGFRNYVENGVFLDEISLSKKLWEEKAYEDIRVKNCIPKYGIELISNETYILEANFIKMSGVSFAKGCFIGQEVTARMRHKTKLRKGLKVVSCHEDHKANLILGSSIFSGGREIGKILSCSNNFAIAFLRFDRIGEQLYCNELALKVIN